MERIVIEVQRGIYQVTQMAGGVELVIRDFDSAINGDGGEEEEVFIDEAVVITRRYVDTDPDGPYLEEKSVKASGEEEAKYLTGAGEFCLKCGYSGDIDGGTVTIEGGKAFQPVLCTHCGAEWTDVYVLSGVTEVQE